MRAVFSIVIGSLVVFAGCSSTPPPSSQPRAVGVAADDIPVRAGVVATFRGGEVTLADLHTWRAARSRGGRPSTVKQEVEEIARAEALEARAAAAGLAEDGRVRFALDLAEQGILATALRKTITASVEVGDEEVDRYIEEHSADLVAPTKVRLRNLFKAVSPGASEAEREQVRTRTEELRAEVVAGADFGELARRESDSQTRLREGIIGNVAAGDLPPAVEQIAFSLAPGEVSEVLEGEEGFTLLWCERVIEGKTTSMDEARDRVRKWYRKHRAQDAWEALEAELRTLDPPSYHLEAVKASPAGDGQVVAVAAGGRLTLRELRWLLEEQRFERPAEEIPAPRLQAVVGQWAGERLAAARARELGLQSDPGVAGRLRWRRSRVLGEAWLEAEVDARVAAPSDDEARAEIEAHPGRYVHPAEQDVSVLWVPADGSSVSAQLDQLESVRAQLVTGGITFEEAARRWSRHPSAGQGGRLGWSSLQRLFNLGAAVADAATHLEPGAVSRVLREEDGLWLVQVHDRRERRPMSPEEALPKARKTLTEKRRAEARRVVEAQVASELDLVLIASTTASTTFGP